MLLQKSGISDIKLIGEDDPDFDAGLMTSTDLGDYFSPKQMIFSLDATFSKIPTPLTSKLYIFV